MNGGRRENLNFDGVRRECRGASGADRLRGGGEKALQSGLERRRWSEDRKKERQGKREEKQTGEKRRRRESGGRGGRKMKRAARAGGVTPQGGINRLCLSIVLPFSRKRFFPGKTHGQEARALCFSPCRANKGGPHRPRTRRASGERRPPEGFSQAARGTSCTLRCRFRPTRRSRACRDWRRTPRTVRARPRSRRPRGRIPRRGCGSGTWSR